MRVLRGGEDEGEDEEEFEETEGRGSFQCDTGGGTGTALSTGGWSISPDGSVAAVFGCVLTIWCV